MTPGRYLALSRLNGAHHDLMLAERSAKTVREIALNWGFTNFTRFRVAYRELFGGYCKGLGWMVWRRVRRVRRVVWGFLKYGAD
jgi:hypothetical protein